MYTDFKLVYNILYNLIYWKPVSKKREYSSAR